MTYIKHLHIIQTETRWLDWCVVHCGRCPCTPMYLIADVGVMVMMVLLLQNMMMLLGSLVSLDRLVLLRNTLTSGLSTASFGL